MGYPDTGWFGRAVSDGVARIAVPGLEADVTVDDVGSELRATVNAAYRAKYGHYVLRQLTGWWVTKPWRRRFISATNEASADALTRCHPDDGRSNHEGGPARPLRPTAPTP